VQFVVEACNSGLNSAPRKYFLRRLQGSHPCALSVCAASLPLLRKYTLSLRLKSCCFCHPVNLSIKRRQVTAKRGVSSRDAGEEFTWTYLQRPRVLLPVVAYKSSSSSRQGNALFAAFDSTSLCCLSLRGIPAAAARAHLAHRPSSCCLFF
jgi:hypothetical protein